ncbi:MAG TPA: ABC transporter permease [Gemmatimonadales bacterium]
MIDAVRLDIRYAVRSLRQAPVFTAVAVVTLALGIGSTTTLFTVVDRVLLRPLPYADPSHIASISEGDHGIDRRVVASPNLDRWRSAAKSVDQIAVYTGSSMALTGVGDPAQLDGARVSANFFHLLGVDPAVGHLFRAGDDAPGALSQVVLSYQLWQDRFGKDSAIVGRQIALGGTEYTVIGVLQRGAGFPAKAQIWTPLVVPANLPSGVTFFYSVIARPHAGASFARVAAELSSLVRQNDATRPAGSRGAMVIVEPLHDRLFGAIRTPLLLLLGAVTCLLLIACANVANLLLARSVSRRREIAVRVALGAGRWRIGQQLMIESILIALVGAGVGMLIPIWAVGIFARVSPQSIAGITDLSVNVQVLAFSIAVGVLTGVVFGVLPAWGAVRQGRLDGLHEGGSRTAGSLDRRRVRRALVIIELATALVLLTGAGLMTRSLVNVMAVDLGFRPEHLSAVTINPPGTRYPTDAARSAFFDALIARVRAIPGVDVAAGANVVPPGGLAMTMPLKNIGGVPDDSTRIAVSTVGRDYPRAVGFELIAGRLFSDDDVRGTAVAVVVTRSTARLLAPHGSVIGRTVPPSMATDDQPGVVVGVVKDVSQVGAETAPLPQLFVAREQVGGGDGVVVIRSTLDPGQLERTVRRATVSIDPLLPVASFQQIDVTMAGLVAPRRFDLLVLGVFAGLALLIAAIGLYGAMSYQVTQRIREMGIRMALGASGGAVQRMIMAQGLGLVGAGCAVGLVISLALTRVMQSLLFGVGARDATTFAVASGVLAVVAGVACYIPARRVTVVDPMLALRND